MNIPVPTIFHFLLMGTSVVFFFSAMQISRKKKESKWLIKHRRTAYTGTGTLIAGFLVMFFYKIASEYPHFQTPHSIGGLVALISALAAPVLGVVMLKGKQRLRAVHRLFGRVTVVLTILTAIIGIIMLILLGSG